jgi:hypothetical protein
MTGGQMAVNNAQVIANRRILGNPKVSNDTARRTILIENGMSASMARSIPSGKLKNYQGMHSYKKGGKVKKTGLAKLHKGERVLTKKQAKKYDKMKRDKSGRRVFK